MSAAVPSSRRSLAITFALSAICWFIIVEIEHAIYSAL